MKLQSRRAFKLEIKQLKGYSKSNMRLPSLDNHRHRRSRLLLLLDHRLKSVDIQWDRGGRGRDPYITVILYGPSDPFGVSKKCGQSRGS